MARIDIKSTGTTLSDGVLQLENGVAMDATLRKVADQNNITSPLLLSTTLVQTTSTLKITTADNPYIDAEDNSGNNRFTVGRDPSSQQVNVDFASNPTGSTTAVGAIRTYGDGVNLSEAMTFREDGNVGIGTNTPGSKIDVHSAANTVAQFNRTGTGNSQIQHLMTGTARWTTGYTSTAGNYSIYDNVNAVFRTNLSNTGKLTIGNGDTALTGVLNIKGSGSTSATTSLLVQNSAANNTLQVLDDAKVIVNGNNSSSGDNFRVNNSSGNYVMKTTNGYATQFGYFGAGDPVSIVDGSVNSAFRAGLPLISPSWYAGYFTCATGDVRIGQGITGTNANPSAILQANSTTQGFLPPRMTTAEKNAIATPAAGLMVYDTNLNKLCVYTGAGWETITSV